MKEKLKAQETKANSDCTQKKTNALFFNREFLKSRSPLQVLARLLS
jgi:hypothetical protein